MARRKNQPDAVKAKYRLSERIHEIRIELHGERGGSEMARRLNLPVRTWYNYEGGVTIPAEVLLRFMEITQVETMWLLHGKGPKFRVPCHSGEGQGTISDLLRTALKRLEDRSKAPDLVPSSIHPAEENGEVVLIRVEGNGRERVTDLDGPRYVAARREWLSACRDLRCVRVDDPAMVPILSEGADVVFSEAEEPHEALAGSLVVAWIDDRPVVRWLELADRFLVLRAENSKIEPSPTLIARQGPSGGARVRRVAWISTPH